MNKKAKIKPIILAMFDLDNTLLKGDSDYLWGNFLIKEKIVSKEYERKNRYFLKEYEEGKLNIKEYLKFSLYPLKKYNLQKLKSLRSRYLKAIRDIIYPKATYTIEKHKAKGHFIIIITSTNNFITKPISKLFLVDKLIATKIEIVDNKITGNIIGEPCFREGKLLKLKEWIKKNELGSNLIKNSYFYSDSINDLPLLKKVKFPVATNPDKVLRGIAKDKGWEIVQF